MNPVFSLYALDEKAEVTGSKLLILSMPGRPPFYGDATAVMGYCSIEFWNILAGNREPLLPIVL